ncbi:MULTISPECIES: mechanosensitive ion channel family protein [Stutzerimonas]|mgnify:FL=1|uniref:Mechanosensing system component YbdG n=4 Tax=Stutzerimonas stutzeri subgroup TaxID=578833 RepID=A0A0D7DZT8_STUST|nr:MULTISPECIES: mechanosensitive ion channel family protein [Stutzerimonas stutzeri group]KJS26177.1 MAG: mechanosensitive ion channel protein MscS [Pseudomonas sp. BRH_c35]MAF87178.1 mechanosensitive ion channel family protein [Pseudomonas sp.]MBU0562623.1 mechanosensitive ion channel family protein [Gammaproteobacteria bacterium]MCB4794699.1 mechanosensitive ion channel family protein [Pseudomonas sp. NP21570]OCX97344.1 MAG: mechanosensitive ion channel protein MscS [Pseudomonas sp. K35]OH
MSDDLAGWLDWLRAHPELQTLLASATLIFAAWLSNWIVKRILVRGLYRLLRHTRDGELQDFGIIKRLSNIVPALVLSLGVTTVPGLPEAAVTVVQNVCGGFIVLTIALALGAVLDIINVVYQRRPDARLHPIKGYLQVVKIVIYAIATILIIATLIDRSPLILLSGLGAMAAVLMLIFQDTLLSLVASVQITSNDLIRVGDWVEMPQLNADGDVIDIALHTVKVQNWDKTITSIPTKRFISDSFKNWRGMQESGGRRIKRSLYLDQQSVHFLDADERKRLYRFSLLEDYLVNKRKEIDEWNAKLAERGQDPVNTRRVTNLGTFRAYVERYLRAHPGVHQNMTLMVRQLSPTADGLPLEIYCFTNTVAWTQYEAIQSDIFDHLLAILPEFGLRVFQHPSGGDVRDWRDSLRQPGAPALQQPEGHPAEERS